MQSINLKPDEGNLRLAASRSIAAAAVLRGITRGEEPDEALEVAERTLQRALFTVQQSLLERQRRGKGTAAA